VKMKAVSSRRTAVGGGSSAGDRSAVPGAARS
jgi:hypothetical protein